MCEVVNRKTCFFVRNNCNSNDKTCLVVHHKFSATFGLLFHIVHRPMPYLYYTKPKVEGTVLNAEQPNVFRRCWCQFNRNPFGHQRWSDEEILCVWFIAWILTCIIFLPDIRASKVSTLSRDKRFIRASFERCSMHHRKCRKLTFSKITRITQNQNTRNKHLWILYFMM